MREDSVEKGKLYMDHGTWLRYVALEARTVSDSTGKLGVHM